MARRNSTESTEATTEGTEPEATSNEPEGTSNEPEGTSNEPEATNEEQVIDLAAFEEATAAAVAARDESTGVIPAADLEQVNVEFRKLDGIKPKNAAKQWLEDQMKDAITNLDVQLARAFSMARDSLKAATATRSAAERTPVDPKAAFVNKLASQRLALSIVERSTPEGVDASEADSEANQLLETLAEQVEQYTTWLESETPEGEEKPSAPEVSPVVRSAFKLANGKASGGGRVSGGSGVRRDTSKHIMSAFEGLEDGAFLTIAQIANHTSTEYGDDHPSQGAVSARIFPVGGGETSVPGIRQAPAEGDRPRGAVKDVSKA